MRTKDEPEIFSPTCICGRPITAIYYHRPCNLVFCGFCIERHECKPVNGPISAEASAGRPVLLPAAPPSVVRSVSVPLNGTSKKHATNRKKKR